MASGNSRLPRNDNVSQYGLFFTRTNFTVERLKEEIFGEKPTGLFLATQNYTPGRDGLYDTYLLLKRVDMDEYGKVGGGVLFKDFRFTKKTEVPIFSNGLNLFIPIPEKIEGVNGEALKEVVGDVLKDMVTAGQLKENCYSFSPANSGHFYINFKHVDKRSVRVARCFLNNYRFTFNGKEGKTNVYIKAHWARSNNNNDARRNFRRD